MQKKYFNSKDANLLIETFGFSIFPIHGTKDDGTCTCNKADCSSVGKHPATPDGFKSASKDIEQVARLWSSRKHLNVGIATGDASGVFVVDIDDPAAEAELAKVVTLPDTYTVTTGRGKHLYFKYDTSRPVKNGAHVIPNVDIRGDGGYVAGPGSNHSNGTRYDAVNPLEDFADAPDALYALLEKPKYEPQPFLDTQTNYLNTNDSAWSESDRREHLSHIDPDITHDDWVKIGMALHSEGNYFNLFDDWSASGTKYEGQKDTQRTWNSFTKGGGVTYGTVVALAKEGGWSKAIVAPVLTHPPSPIEHVDMETGEIKEKRMYLISAKYVEYEVDANDFVQGTLTAGGMSVVYGESNCGKTFFMTDMSFSIAENKPWRDKRVEGGPVVYVALEGIRGLKGRVEAYKREHNTELKDFHIMPCAFDFLDAAGDVTEFLELLRDNFTETGVKLIVIDTLARAVGGGDENSGQDMGMLVKHADAIREQTGAHICFVHHSGKDKAKGARGHSSLRAAVDTELEVSREEDADYSNVKTVKQRDMEMADDMQFQLTRVVLGTNKHGEEVSSCVVEPVVIKVKEKTVSMNPVQTFIYNNLVRAITDHGAYKNINDRSLKVVSYDELRLVMEDNGFKEMMATEKKSTSEQIKSATQSARLALQKNNKISFNGRFIWLLNDEDY